MEWLVVAMGGGASLCVAIAVLVVLVLVARRALSSAPSPPEITGPSAAQLAADERALGEVDDQALCRDLLLHRIEHSLGPLGDALRVTKGSQGDLRLRGTLGGEPAAVDIAADGQLAQATVQGSFSPGRLVLHAHLAPDDPDGQLVLLPSLEVASLTQQIKAAGLTALQFAPDGLTATGSASLHELEAGKEGEVVSLTLAVLQNAVGLWHGRQAPEAPGVLPPPTS